MRQRVHEILTSRLVPRVTVLGILASLMAMAPLGVLTPAAHAATGDITEIKPAGIMQTGSSDPLGIVTGADSNLWFTDAGETLGTTPAPSKQVERYDPNTGLLSQFTAGGEPSPITVAITVGADSDPCPPNAQATSGPCMWAANAGASANDIVRLDRTGGQPVIYGIRNPTGATGVPNSPMTGPRGIATGTDGKIWFTEFGAGAIGRIDPTCANPDSTKSDPCEADFPLPLGLANPGVTATASGDLPLGITVDKTNNLLWVTVQGSQTIVGFDPSAQGTPGSRLVIAHSVHVGVPNLAGITMGPDHNVWFTAEAGGNSAIGRINPLTGTEILPRVTALPSNTNPSAITAGPDGNMYFVDQGANAIGQIIPGLAPTVAREFSTHLSAHVFSPNVEPTGITVGPDNNIWFTENHDPSDTNTSSAGLGKLAIAKAVEFSPAPVAFGTVLPNHGKTLTITASNTSNLPVTISSAQVTTPGANASEFVISNNNCVALTSGATCTLQITFTPTAAGSRGATLSFSDSGVGSPHTVALTGVGQASAPTFGPANGAFGSAFIGSPTKPINFSMTNNTGLAVQVGAASLGAPNPNDFRIVNDSCSRQMVADNSSCSISVVFAPTTLNSRSSNITLTLADGTRLGPSTLSGTGVAAPPGSNPGHGYWEVASDGGIFNYGSAGFFGSAGAIHLNKPIVGMARTPDGLGYWLVATDGGIFNYGTAKFFGSAGSIHLNQPIVGMASTPDGTGYWLVASDGGIFNYGSANFFGSTGSIHLNKPIVGMSSAPDGQGYWLVATDGGIFNYGSSKFFGSTGSIHLNQPIVGMASTPDGTGYWLAATDGGIFNYGSSKFFGSTGSIHLNQPVVTIAAAFDGAGYWMSASDGGIFNFGDAGFFGSAGAIHLNQPMVGMAAAT